MTEATFDPRPEAPRPPEPAGPIPLRRGPNLAGAWALFAMTIDRHLRSRRLIVMALLSALPILLVGLFRYYEVGEMGPPGAGYEPEMAEFVSVFVLIAQGLVPLTALIYASGIIQDEVEEQTLTYLLIRPLSKPTIYLAKLLATVAVAALLIVAFTTLAYAVIEWGVPGFWKGEGPARVFRVCCLFALMIATYCALFAFMGVFFRRALVAGLAYIIGFEAIIANLPIAFRKLTVVYYFRVLCERWLSLGKGDQFALDLDTAPDISACVWTLAGAGAALTALAILGFTLREYRLKTPEGS